MWILIVIIIVAGTIAAGASLLWDKDKPLPVGECGTCDGSKLDCGVKECRIEVNVQKVEYFDDEELDQYAGRASNSYTAQEADLFREIMETLHHDDLWAWSKSLTLRGINMPDEVKDEYILLLGN